MSDRDDFPIEGEPSASRFHIPQPNRNLQSNWELDLAKNLEEYLLNICSGEVSSDQESSINFAEAALLLQGSVQVYSRKVEYLYSLVWAALDFLSQKRLDQQENASAQPDGSESNAVIDYDNDVFLGLDDVPVEPKNCLDRCLDKEDPTNHLQKPPATLLVLEGDCLDSSGDAGELESYLLSTCNFYRDFLLLDPCDASSVYIFLKTNGVGKDHAALHNGGSLRSKNRRSNFVSPTGRSGGTPHRVSLGRKNGVTPNDTSACDHMHGDNISNIRSEPTFDHDYYAHAVYNEEEPTFGVSNDGDDSDSDNDDPWKPLDPHEHGNLKIKPFKASKPFGRQVIHNSRRNTVSSQFPIAKVDGIISPQLAESFEKLRLEETQNASQSPPYFEKLRRSFTNVEETFDTFGSSEYETDDNGLDNSLDFEHVEFDLPNNTYDMDAKESPNLGKKDAGANFDGTEAFFQDDPGSEASLEDLCRSHLDALLASIAESEKQTELATRVSTWKQRIEQSLEEQDTHPPFDVHQYGETILDKLSLREDSGANMSFTDVVKGQPKHDVARTISALLQLVNNGDVGLQKAPASSELICYTAENPFAVKLLRSSRTKKEAVMYSARERVKSPPRNRRSSNTNALTSPVISPPRPSQQTVRLSVKHAEGTVIRCTPERKRRRLAEAVDLKPAG